MRKAAKVFLIIGMIYSFVLVFPIIIGSIAINRLNTAKKREELTGIGVAALLLVSTLGGIFMLCVSQEELDKANNVVPDTSEPQKEIKAKEIEQKPVTTPVQEEVVYEYDYSEEDRSVDYIENIKELKTLLDNGALTQEEYDILKKEQLGI